MSEAKYEECIKVLSENDTDKWFYIGDSGMILEGQRLHCNIQGRFITIFRHKGKLSAIDSICHHAGGINLL